MFEFISYLGAVMTVIGLVAKELLWVVGVVVGVALAAFLFKRTK